MKKVFILSFIGLSLFASDAILDYFYEAQKNLQFDSRLNNINKIKQLQEEMIKTKRYANFSIDLQYMNTKANLLPNRYNVTDFTVADTIDIFNKSRFQLQKIILESKQNEYLLKSQKEELFLSLMNIIASYNKIEKIVKIHTKFYHEEQSILQEIQKAVQIGSLPKMDEYRFANRLALFKATINKEKNALATLRKQLKLYVPNMKIPKLHDVELTAKIKKFLSNCPAIQQNILESKILKTKAQNIEKSWMPDVVLGTTYEKNSDPTANGDNYSFFAGIHISINPSLSKEAESYKVLALQKNSESLLIQTKEKERFIKYLGAIHSAQSELQTLKPALKQAKKNFQAIKKAYLKRYVDFTAYSESFQTLITIYEQYITAKIKKEKNVIIVNTLSNGAIYE